jgi:poly(beta-D-mannuronate) lyase
MFILAAVALAGASPARARSGCPAFPPVMTLETGGIYQDYRTSIPDQTMAQATAARKAPIEAFLKSVEGGLDSADARPGNPASDCALRNFAAWGDAGALTREPPDFSGGGKLARDEYNVGFQMIALKFKAAGYPLPAATLAWLDTMNAENIAYFMKASNRGNLRVWAAAGAALHALLRRDQASLRFQDQVWREAVAAIHDDGTIDAEVGRGQRALIYHLYSFAATQVLRSARASLGYRETPPERERINRLVDLIARNLCTPDELSGKAGMRQEAPGDWEFRVTNAFNSAEENGKWSRCVKLDGPASHAGFGGDMRRAVRAVAAAGR